MQASRENGNTDLRGHLRGTWVNLGIKHSGDAKLTLGSTSEMTPDVGVTVFLLACIHRETPVFTGKSPKMAKKCQKRGYPFLTVFSVR